MKKVLPAILLLFLPVFHSLISASPFKDNTCMECLTAPTLFCPSTYFGCPDDNLNPSLTGTPTALPGDINCPTPQLSYTDTLIIDQPCLKKYHRIWTASYPADSASTKLRSLCIQTLYLEDTDTPEFDDCPQDIIVNLNENCDSTATWALPVASDGCGIASLISNYNPGDVFPEGTTTVQYLAEDNCGKQDSCSFTVQLIGVCCLDFSFTCPPDTTVCVGSDLNPSETGLATASMPDSTCVYPYISYTDSILGANPNCLNGNIIQRQWYATDSLQTTVYDSCFQIITTGDNINPIISNTPADLVFTGTGPACSVFVTWTEPNAEDDCGIVSFNPNIPNGILLNEGDYTVVYTAVDNCGHIATSAFNVTILCDNGCPLPPNISCPPNYWACPDGGIPSPAESGYATATAGSSECGTPIISFTDTIVASGPCPTSKIIERTWTARDPDNPQVESSCIQTLSLEDQQAPYILYCPQNIYVNATGSGSYCSTSVSWDSPLAIDNCAAPDLAAYDSNGNLVNNGQSFDAGTTTVIYTATDNCGNTATCQFDVTVNCVNQCNTPPSIYCPANKTVCPGSSTSPQLLGYASASAGPNCPSPSVNFSDVIISSGPCYGEKVINRNWTAGYYNYPGLNSSCVQTIKLKDTQAPYFSYCPADITVYNTATPVWWNTPQASDNCGTPTVTSTHNPGSYFPVGTTTVRYTAKDNCWNTVYCSFKVTVLNSYNITLNCPADINLDCGSNGGAYAYWSPPSYNGNCGNCGSNNQYIPGFIYMGTLNGSEYYCSTGSSTWPQAKSICESKGGYLASIGSHQENQFLANILNLQSAWIGLSDAQNEGQFRWESGENLVYTNWYTGQPNDYNSSQDYVEMLNDGKWNDQYNHYALEFIMEIPCGSVQQTGGPAPGSFLTAGNYTVTYQVQDACGGFGSCSFNISVSGGLDITCPADITVSAPANSQGVPVNWGLPEASSCCSQCYNYPSQNINGFVYMGSLNGHDYYCSTSVASWPAAKLNCESKGGHLAVISSQAENDFLANLLNLQSAWIGLHDSNTEGSFEWVNGQPLNYTNWYPGQPNNYNNIQDYVELLNDGQWNDQYNHYTLEYIMEIPSCVNINQTSGPQNGSVLLPGSTHTVSYEATDACGNVANCSFDIYVEPINMNVPYCDSQSKNSLEFHIVSVVLGQMSNTSGDDNGYGDYTNICASVEEGQSYPMHLTPMINQQDRNYWRVWIDFNMDGDFYDANEMVAYGSGISTVSGIVTMPPILSSGETRMRIVMSPLGYPNDPCGSYQIGETEDYCISLWGTGTVSEDTELETRNYSAMQLLDQNSEITVSLYPNPATDFATIDIEIPEMLSDIILSDINGKLLQRWKGNQIRTNIQIDLRDKVSGIYMIQLKPYNGDIIFKKLIVSR